MPLPFFPRPPVSHGNQEKLSGSEIADENDNNPGISMFQQLESFCCPTWPDYSTPTGKMSVYISGLTSNLLYEGYHSISSPAMYEAPTVPAYSPNLDSSNHHQISPHQQVIISSGAEQSSLFFLSADSQPSHQLQEKFPPLQPGTYLSTLPPVGQEPMSYQSLSASEDTSKSDDTSPTFVRPKIEHEYSPVDYRTGPSTSLGIATDYTASGIPESKASPCINHDLVRYAAPQRYQLSHSYAPQEPVRTEQFAYIPFDSQGNRLEVVLPNDKPPISRRGPFKDPQKRAKTAVVRKIGSCIRCRMQRIRVSTTVPGTEYMLTFMIVRV